LPRATELMHTFPVLLCQRSCEKSNGGRFVLACMLCIFEAQASMLLLDADSTRGSRRSPCACRCRQRILAVFASLCQRVSINTSSSHLRLQILKGALQVLHPQPRCFEVTRWVIYSIFMYVNMPTGLHIKASQALNAIQYSDIHC
jgi:hypothetical protein